MMFPPKNVLIPLMRMWKEQQVEILDDFLRTLAEAESFALSPL